MVEGYVEDDSLKKLWRSTNIEFREDSRTLKTRTGTTYKLVGSCNKSVCLLKGLFKENNI